jgi:hypothetical protein
MEDEQDCIIERKDTKHTSDVEVTEKPGADTVLRRMPAIRNQGGSEKDIDSTPE